MKNKITHDRLERVSRIYNTAADAALALGISPQTYSRLCKKHAIETPAQRKQRRKKEAKRLNSPKLTAARQDIIKHMDETPEEAEAAIEQFEARCRARVEAL